MNRVTTHPLPTIDEFVEAYEAAREASTRDESPRPEEQRPEEQIVDLLDYLPAADEPCFQEVATELIRVDMEYSWNQGKRKKLADYQAILPAVFHDQGVVEQVAYEEYRLRAQAGENVSADEYHRQYGIATDQWSHWPLPESSAPQSSAPPHTATESSTAQNPVAQNSVAQNSAPQNSTPRKSPPDTSPPSSIPALWQEALQLADEVQDFPAVGDSFLGFSLAKELGRGAFSHVFLARQGELAERLVVLKIASGTTLEPQHLARLQHTNIVPIYSVHCHEKLTAVCMPYFGHRTLADLLSVVRQESGSIGSQQNLISTFLNRRDPTERMPIASPSQAPLGVPQQQTKAEPTPASRVLKVLAESSYVDAALWLVKQMAEGLAHAHDRGIVHRDLKPANVLLTDEGLPMLLDFNLSTDVVVHGRTSLLVGGTLPYMSPEHLQAVTAGGHVGTQADIFSLGIMLYELLTGTRPFADRRGTFDDVVREMIKDRQTGCRPVRDRNRTVPRSIEAVVSRCLATNTQQRYATAGELAEDLERHLRYQPLLHAPDRSVAERSKKWLKRHPRLSSAGGVAALASAAFLLILGLWILRGQRIATFQAEDVYQAFSQQQPSLHMALGMSHTDEQILRDSIASTRTDLEIYGLPEDDHWQQGNHYRSLSSSSKSALNRRLGELLYMAARANEQLLPAAVDNDDRLAMIRDSRKFNRLAQGLFSAESCPRALLLQQARLLELTGSPEKAQQTRLLAAEQPHQNIVDQYAEVYDLHDAKNYREAKPLLLALRKHSPADPVPWLLLGDANAALGDLDESEGCFTTAATLEPGSYMAYFCRGLCRMQLNKLSGALADFEQVTTLRPQLAAGFLNRALVQSSLGNEEEAIADLTKALDLGATQTRVYFLRSKLRRRIGDLGGAEADIEIGLERTPTDELSWVSRGVAQLALDPEAALADFRQALRLNPVSSTALHNCVHVLADRLNKREEALAIVNQLLRLDDQDTDALASRAVLYAREANGPAAMADIQQLLRLSKTPKALFQAACALSLTSQPENSNDAKALTLLSRAILLEPKWFARAQTDPDLKSLRATKAFQTFAANTRNINLMKFDLNKPSSQK